MDLRKIVEDADTPRDTVKRVEEKLTPREIQFSLVYEAGGNTREAVLTSRIMTGDERFKASRIAADIAGRPWNVLPANTQIHAISLGTLAVQLRNPPEWVLDAAQEDEDLAVQLFASCRGHDDKWYKRGRQEDTGGTEKPRIRISPIGVTSVRNE